MNSGIEPSNRRVWFWSDDLPPSDNKRLIFVRGSRRLVPNPKAKEFEKQLTAAWVEVMAKGPVFPVDEIYRAWMWVLLTIVLPDMRRRDVTNLLKVPIDAIVRAGIIEDDCRVLGAIKSVFRGHSQIDAAKPNWPWQAGGADGGILIELFPVNETQRPNIDWPC